MHLLTGHPRLSALSFPLSSLLEVPEMKRLSAASRGFTLIELIIVIAIVGVLAAVAIPKFTNLSSNAQSAATQGIAGALASASATNYAVSKVTGATFVPVGNCTDVGTALQGGLGAGYSITSNSVTADLTVSCTLTGPGAVTATFTAHGT
jgi:MSHA pilin protein MshA